MKLKYLSFILDSKLNFHSHADFITKKMNTEHYMLSKAKWGWFSVCCIVWSSARICFRAYIVYTCTHSFADNTTINVDGSNVFELVKYLNNDLINAYEYLQLSSMFVKINKYKTVVISNKCDSALNIVINYVNPELANEIKYLVLIFHTN